MQNDFNDWIIALKANDEKSLEKLYTENYGKVEHYVLTNSGNKDQAKDIFQDAFIVCWRAIQDGQFYPQNESSASGYLYKIAKYKWLDYLRSGHYKKVIPLMDDVEHWEPPVENKEDDEERQKVAANFKKLGNECREVLTHFYFNKKSMKEIAAVFGWTEATARNNKYRCIQKLKKLINPI